MDHPKSELELRMENGRVRARRQIKWIVWCLIGIPTGCTLLLTGFFAIIYEPVDRERAEVIGLDMAQEFWHDKCDGLAYLDFQLRKVEDHTLLVEGELYHYHDLSFEARDGKKSVAILVRGQSKWPFDGFGFGDVTGYGGSC